MAETLTLAQAAQLTAGAAMWQTAAVPEADIPAVNLADGPMGVTSGRVDERDVSLLSPCGHSLGASWDPDLIARVAQCIAEQARDRDVHALLAPNVNLPRSPLVGRAFEMYSEDPLLTGLIAVGWIEGLQSRGVAAIVKHLVCNDSETQRNTMNAVVDEQTLREVYLLPFEMAAAADVAGILTAYNRVNGDYCSEHRQLLTSILRDEWQWDGLLVSDWFGTTSDAGLAAGLDLEMPGPPRFLGETNVLAALESGAISEHRVRDAARHVGSLARQYAVSNPPDTLAPDPDETLTEAAAAGFVLLRNRDAILPLDGTLKGNIAVIGPNAADPCYQGGTFAKISVNPDTPTPLKTLQDWLGPERVIYAPGVLPERRLPLMPVTPPNAAPDGPERGMMVEYFDSHDLEAEPIARETRDTNCLTWFAGSGVEGVWDRDAAVRASGCFTAKLSGVHRFFAGASSAFRLQVDGAVVLEREHALPAADVMGALKSCEADGVDLELHAGQTVEVVAELRYGAGRVHGLWYGIAEPADEDALLAEAEACASASEQVLLFIGETADSGVESRDRSSTRLGQTQEQLARRVIAANPNTVVIANVGHAFDPILAEQAAALLVCWYPGERFSEALVEVLSGQREPSGRLPVTLANDDRDYPALNTTPDTDGNLVYHEGVLGGYRGFAAAGHQPAYAFGSGFGYTTFSWSEPEFLADRARVTVTNTGTRAGSEVVQVYRHHPEQALVGFCKCLLQPGESQRVEVVYDPRLLRRWDNGWQPLQTQGAFSLSRSASDTVYTASR